MPVQLTLGLCPQYIFPQEMLCLKVLWQVGSLSSSDPGKKRLDAYFSLMTASLQMNTLQEIKHVFFAAAECHFTEHHFPKEQKRLAGEFLDCRGYSHSEERCPLTCGGIDGEGAEAFGANNAIKVELISARRQQAGHGDIAGIAIQGQHLGLALGVFVLNQERVKAANRNTPGQTDRVAGDLGDGQSF